MHIKRKHAKESKSKVINRRFKLSPHTALNPLAKLLLNWLSTMLINILFGLNCDIVWPIAILGKSLVDRYSQFGPKLALTNSIMILTTTLIAALMINNAYLTLISSICSRIHLVIFYFGNGLSMASMLTFMFLTYAEVLLHHNDLRPYGNNSDIVRFCALINVGYLNYIICECVFGRCKSFLRSRTQRSVRSQNASYYSLLETALPEELWCYLNRTFKSSSKCIQAISNGPSYPEMDPFSNKPNLEKCSSHAARSLDKTIPIGKAMQIRQNNYTYANKPNNSHHKNSNIFDVNRFEPSRQCISSSSDRSSSSGSRQSSPADSESPNAATNDVEVPKESALSSRNDNQSYSNSNGNPNSNSTNSSSNIPRDNPSSSQTGSCNTGSDGNQGGSGDGNEKKNPRSHGTKHAKDETTIKLESESRKLRAELQTLRSIEADLRRQMTAKVAAERASRAELDKVKMEFDTLTSKLQSISERIETDRKNLENAEKKLTSERTMRQDLEQQLAELRKSSMAVLGPNCTLLNEMPIQNGSVDENGHYDVSTNCSKSKVNTCSSRVKKLESEIKAMTKELSLKDAQISSLKSASELCTAQSSTSSKTTSTNCNLTNPTNGSLVAAASLAVGAAITPDMSEQLQIKKNEFQKQELSNLKQELHRLRMLLNEEEDNKHKINKAYLDSLKKVTDLQALLADKECEISHLNDQLDHLTPVYFRLKSQDGPGSSATIRPPSISGSSEPHPYKGSCLMNNILISGDPIADNMYSMRTTSVTNGHSQHHVGHLQSPPSITSNCHFGQFPASENDTDLRYRSFTGYQQRFPGQVRPPTSSSSAGWFLDASGLNSRQGQTGSPPESRSSIFSRGGCLSQSGGSFIGRTDVYGSELPDFGVESTSSAIFDCPGFASNQLNESQFRCPSPRDFLVPSSVSTGRSKIVDNYFANKQQNVSKPEPVSKAGGLLFTLDGSSCADTETNTKNTASSSSNESSSPPVEEGDVIEEHRTMRILEGMLDDSRHRSCLAQHHDTRSGPRNLQSYTDQSHFLDDLNTLD